MTGLSAEELASTAVQVVAGLWVGGGRAAVPAGVSMVVTLDAATPQVTTEGVTEVRAHFRDTRFEPVPHDVVQRAVDGVPTVTGTLIRCTHGLNRSALVAALALRARGDKPEEAIQLIRTARPGALNNPYFVDLVRRWPDDPMPSWKEFE